MKRLINFLGRKLGNYYYTRQPDELELQTWVDGFKVMLLYILSSIVLIGFGIVTGEWLVLLLNISTLLLLRSVEEGRHFSIDHCFFVTNGILLLSTILSTYLLKNCFVLCIILLLVSLVLLFRKTLKNKRKLVFVLYLLVFLLSVFFIESIYITVLIIVIDYSTYHKNKL